MSFIFKSNLTTASNYLQSDLFKKSYPKASKFRFVINYKMQGKPLAGVLFLSKFFKMKVDVPINSANVAMFVDNVAEKTSLL